MTIYKAVLETLNTVKPITYLVTGAAGFIGSKICEDILRGSPHHSVIGIDNLNTYYSPTIKRHRLKTLLSMRGFHFYKTSILSKATVMKIFQEHRPSILIHTAAQVGVRNGEANPSLYFLTNAGGTASILEIASQYIQHAVLFSSSSVYGSLHKTPYRETDSITIGSALSTYGASKIAMEHVAHSFYRNTLIPTTIIRPFSVYGPAGRPDMLPMKLLIASITKRRLEIYSPTSTFRDWTYIEDFSAALLRLMKEAKGIQTINIGSGNPVRLDTTIETSIKVIQKYGHTVKCVMRQANPSEMQRTHADLGQLKRLIQIPKVTSYLDGFTASARYFYANLSLFGL